MSQKGHWHFLSLLFFFFSFSVLPCSRHQLCAQGGQVGREASGFSGDLGPSSVCAHGRTLMHTRTHTYTHQVISDSAPKSLAPRRAPGAVTRAGIPALGVAGKGIIVSGCPWGD